MNLLSPPPSTGDKTSSYGDIIAHIIAYLVSLFPAASGKPNIDVPSLSKQISLVLVGAIILSSVSVVLRGVTRVSRPFREPKMRALNSHPVIRRSELLLATSPPL